MAPEEPLEDLLARTALGDRTAFRALYGRTSAKLYGVCLRILTDRADADDALQDAYVRIWHNAHRYSPDRARPITWMVAIARNGAIDRYRARGVVTILDLDAALDAPDPGVSPEDAAAASGERRRLEQCLAEIAPRHAAAIRAAYLGGHTYEALARSADVPIGTMKSWIRRGLIRLRACLAP
jgi:RNA polymerase sigma-70 factor (ECF subfamily)